MDPRAAYRQGEARGSKNPVRLVVLLYEQVIQDLHRAVASIACGDVEGRTRELDHALLVIGQLRATLDLARGEEVGSNLDRFYGLMLSNLIEAQVKGSGEILEQQIEHFLSLREAWLEVEQANSVRKVPEKATTESAAEALPHTDWSV